VKAICKRNDGYEFNMTVGKVYEIRVEPGIFESDPYAIAETSDNGKGFACHLRRFTNLDGSEINGMEILNESGNLQKPASE
jgi:hypothetical protein